MSVADDFALVEAFIRRGSDDENPAGPIRWNGTEPERVALARIKAKHQELLDAVMRVTDLANAKHAAWLKQTRGVSMESLTAPREIRDALGPAYLGGPLQ